MKKTNKNEKVTRKKKTTAEPMTIINNNGKRITSDKSGLGKGSKKAGYFCGVRSAAVYVDQKIAVEILRKTYGIDPSSNEADSDVYNIYVGVNLWCAIFDDVLNCQTETLVNRIRLYGLDLVIEEADDHCLFMTSEGTYGKYSEFWGQFYNLDRACTRNGITKWRMSSVERFSTEYRDMLTLLKFLKKLRIESQDYSFMFKDYKDHNRRCGLWNRNDYSYYDLYDNYDMTSGQNFAPKQVQSYTEWSSYYRTASDRLLDDVGEALFWIFREYKRKDTLFTLPPGVTYEGAKTYLDKFKIVISNQAWLREHGVNIPVVQCNKLLQPSDCNRYILVPKNYKKGRGVAPEPVSRQVLGYQVDHGMRVCLKRHGVDLNDQSKNQKLCSEALGEKRNLATIDKSSASDSISYRMACRLYSWNQDLLSDLLLCRTSYINVDGEVIKNHRFATMGNAITCSLQSGIYLAMAKVAYDYVWIFRDKRSKKKYNFDADVAVYNDDVILPSEVAPTYMQIAEALGFDINTDKTYAFDQKYRESCGVEFVYHRKKMCDVTGAYYPRGTSRNALPELVGLQHKLYMYPSANAVITNLILDVFPEMTVSGIGSQYSDIWSSEPIDRIRGTSKYGKIVYKVYISYVTNRGSALQLKTEEDNSVHIAELCTVDSGLDKEAQLKYICDAYQEWSSKNLHSLVRCWFGPKKLVSLPDPLEPYGVLHTTVTSKSAKVNLSSGDSALVELLMYLLNIGGGLEHINSNEYAIEADHVMDRRDLVSARREQVQNLFYLW